MKEEFLHYLWKYGLFDKDKLFDDEGNKIIVINPGEYNYDAGPDFFNARLKINNTVWAGNVEVHVKSSFFCQHGHQNDPSYDNVILHVVAENDKPVYNTKGEKIPTVEMTYDKGLLDRYNSLINNPLLIACQPEIKHIDKQYIHHWLTVLAVERLQNKSDHLLHLLEETRNDWEESFYRLISRYFGFKVNAEPFEMLAKALPLKIIKKHADNRLLVESLLYGTAGLLDAGLFKEAVHDAYFSLLTREYTVMQTKYSLRPIHGWLWKFSKLRPANFPTIRLSQLAALLTTSEGLFSKAVSAKNVSELSDLFYAEASDYWKDHFVFGKKSRSYRKIVGKQATDIFLINAVVPAIFLYGKKIDDQNICDKALTFLESIDAEDNVIIDEWKGIGITAESAFLSQALIQLRIHYCKKRRCLYCDIGRRLISRNRPFADNSSLLLEP